MIEIDEDFVKQRIAKLRTQQGVSARGLSLILGQSAGYINTIENGKSLPSMAMFLAICDYFKISPKDFFDDEMIAPQVHLDLMNECKKLDEKSLQSLLAIVKSMKK